MRGSGGVTTTRKAPHKPASCFADWHGRDLLRLRRDADGQSKVERVKSTSTIPELDGPISLFCSGTAALLSGN